MNRLLSILVTLFILFLVYLWIHHLLSTSAHSQSGTTLTRNTLTDIPAEEEELFDSQNSGSQEAAREPEPEPVTKSEPEPVPAKQEEPVKPVQEPEPPKQVPPKEPVAKENTAPVKPAPVAEKKPTPAPEPKPAAKPSTHPSGAHLVVAGNFLARGNAEERVKQLRKLGYAQAEVVNFELSEYHTACAGRYSDINEARRVAKKIKESHNIDTYVRHGN